ncbi:fibronectin type III domain-containing protein, partial [Hymenobacter jeollabukensis]
VCADGSRQRTGPVSFFTRPANDECASAQVLVSNATCSATPGTVFQSTNSQIATTGCTGTADDDVWYKFTATSAVQDIRVAEGAGFDGVVQAFSGSCAFVNPIGCIDATAAGGVEVLPLSGLTVGQEYLVRVFSFSATAPTAANGGFTICVLPGVPAPANDECATATTLTVGATCTPTAGTVYKSTNSGISALSCTGLTATADDDVWYKFTPATAAVDIRLEESANFDGVIQLFNGASCTAFTGSVACEDATAGGSIEILQATGLTPGQTYYFRVFSQGAVASTDANSSFQICVSLPTPAPANDECTGATTLAVGAACTPVNGTTYKATASAGAPACTATAPGTPDDDVWFKFTPTTTSVDLTLAEGAGFDGVIQVYAGSCGSLTSLQCVDATSAAGTEQLRVPGLTVGQAYYVRVYSFTATAPTASTSNFTICAAASPAPPANDECANAQTLPVLLGVNCTSPTAGTNAGASATAGVPAPGCGSYSGGDVWYKVTVPPSGALKLETSNGASNPLTDTDMAVYAGSCGSLTLVSCAATGGTNSHALLNLTGRTAGEVLYVRVWENGNNQEGNFLICATSPTTCPEPSALAATAITNTGATLVWAGSGTGYRVEVGPTGFTPGVNAPGAQTLTASSASLVLTNLSPNTGYCFYVTQVCSATANPSP